MPEANPYLVLKLARELYRKAPHALDAGEHHRVAKVADRQATIEQRILATDEAMCVMLPDESLIKSIAEIRARYPSEDEFHADLERHGLAEADLCAALRRELTVEAVLEHVSSGSVRVSDIDVEIFYLTNQERFRCPETRQLSQILVTINEELPGNERPAARTKIEAIRLRLLTSPERFAEQALKHSECPSAMNGGALGEVSRGKLYAELEPVAFGLEVKEISAITESPLGFHLLRCDAIKPERILPFAEVRKHIHSHLQDSRRRVCEKAWIGQLLQSGE